MSERTKRTYTSEEVSRIIEARLANARQPALAGVCEDLLRRVDALEARVRVLEGQ